MNTINTQAQVAKTAQLGSAQGAASNVAANGDFFAAFLQSLMNGGSDSDMLTIMSGFLNSKNGETDKDVSVQEMAAMLNSSFGTNFDLASIVGGGGANTLESVLGNVVGANGMTAEQIESMTMLGANGGSNGIFDSLMGGNENQSGNSIFGSNQSMSNENNILNQMMTLNSARQMVNGGTFDNISQKDTLAAVTAMMQGDMSKVNTIITNDQNSIQSLTNGKSGEMATASQGVPVQIVSGDASAKSSGEELYNGDMNFKSSVFQARQLMKDQKNIGDETPSSYEVAAQSASNPSVASVEAQNVAVAAPTAVDLDDLTDKIDAGIRTGDFTSSKEFAVKLRPEGLGDVTIRVVKEQNQITMSIVTASSEAAKLLNEQLPSLRQNLNAMNVNVNEVVAQQTNEQAAYEQQQQSFTGFNGEQQNSFYQSPSTTSFSSFSGEEDAAQISELSYVDSEHMKVYA